MSISRRRFAYLSVSAATAARFTPQAFSQTSVQQTRRIGYAVVGLGRIATHFLAGTAQSEHSQITALVSGHPDKAKRIAAQYGFPAASIYSYDDFDRIASNPTIDAVYIALLNSMHAEYTVRAGKHVLL